MTKITYQDNKIVMNNGKVGTEIDCCCDIVNVCQCVQGFRGYVSYWDGNITLPGGACNDRNGDIIYKNTTCEIFHMGVFPPTSCWNQDLFTLELFQSAEECSMATANFAVQMFQQIDCLDYFVSVQPVAFCDIQGQIYQLDNCQICQNLCNSPPYN